jgi:hypothetical protein
MVSTSATHASFVVLAPAWRSTRKSLTMLEHAHPLVADTREGVLADAAHDGCGGRIRR